MTMTTEPSQGPNRGPKPPPAGLSKWAQAVWTQLMTDNHFGRHEEVVFHRALRWWDVADRLLAEAEALDEPERARKLKSAVDASSSALRLWRTLRFVDPARPARRPGRGADSEWSDRRRAAQQDYLRRIGGTRADG